MCKYLEQICERVVLYIGIAAYVFINSLIFSIAGAQTVN
jgi:hypothetical protein